jgi:hypothetical protein
MESMYKNILRCTLNNTSTTLFRVNVAKSLTTSAVYTHVSAITLYLDAIMNSILYGSTPIDTRVSEIRLIELLPGEEEDPISCVFHRRALGSSNLEFRALSYTWGNPSPTFTILIDTLAFNIRQNLWLFLCGERRCKRTGFIWIDALCIDQSNAMERNHQVALMKEIYSQVT